MHIAAFIVLLSPLSLKAARWVDKAESTTLIAGGLVVLAFIAAMMQHLTGNILFEVVLGQLAKTIPAEAYAGIWTAVFFAYPVERSILIASAVLIGTPLIWTICKNPILRVRKQET